MKTQRLSGNEIAEGMQRERYAKKPRGEKGRKVWAYMPTVALVLVLTLVWAAPAPATSASGSGAYYVSTGNDSGLRLRSGPSKSSTSLNVYENGSQVTVHEVVTRNGDRWARVTAGHQDGYMLFSMLSVTTQTVSASPTPVPNNSAPEVNAGEGTHAGEGSLWPENAETPAPNWKPYDRWISSDGHKGAWLLREPYDEAEKIKLMSDGTRVTCQWSISEYKRVTVGGVEGYVNAMFLTYDPDVEKNPANSYGNGVPFYVDDGGKSVAVFREKDISSYINCVVPHGGKVYVYYTLGEWSNVRVSDGLLGWIQSSKLSKTQPKAFMDSSVTLYLSQDTTMRAKPSTGAAAVMLLPYRTAVSVLNMNGIGNYDFSSTWAYVRVNGKTGYVPHNLLFYDVPEGDAPPVTLENTPRPADQTPPLGEIPSPTEGGSPTVPIDKTGTVTPTPRIVGKYPLASRTPIQDIAAVVGEPTKILQWGTVLSKVSRGYYSEMVPTSSLTMAEGIPPDKVLAVVWTPRTGQAAMRSSKSDTSKLLKLCKAGRVVPVLEYSKKKTKIRYNGAEGYIKTECLKFMSVVVEPTAFGKLSYNGFMNGATTVNVRLEPKGRVIGEFRTGTAVTVTEQDEDWSSIEVEGIRGYVMNKHLTMDEGE